MAFRWQSRPPGRLYTYLRFGTVDYAVRTLRRGAQTRAAVAPISVGGYFRHRVSKSVLIVMAFPVDEYASIKRQTNNSEYDALINSVEKDLLRGTQTQSHAAVFTSEVF